MHYQMHYQDHHQIYHQIEHQMDHHLDLDLLNQLDDDSLTMILNTALKDRSFKQKLQLSHVCRRWRRIVLHFLSHSSMKLGLKSQSFPSCPSTCHAIRETGLIDCFFKKMLVIEGRIHRKVEAWKLIRILSLCPRTSVLSVSSSVIHPKLLTNVAKVAPLLQHLDLSNCHGLTLRNLPREPLPLLKRLKHLNLRSTDISDDLAAYLMLSAPNLEAISLSGDFITGRCLRVLPETVKTLAFGGRCLTSDAVDSLLFLAETHLRTGLLELKLIDLDSESIDQNVKTNLLRICCELFPNLKSLVFKNCGLSSFNFPLLEIRRLTNMEVLRIVSNSTEDIIFGDMAILNMIELMPNLVYLQLDLVAWNLYTDPKHVFESVAKSCPRLKYLSIRKWISLKAQSLVYLSQLKSLVYVDIGQISYFNKINLHGEVIELLTDLADQNLSIFRLNSHFPDNDRFLAVLIISEILSKRRPPDMLFRLDLPLYSKDYDPITESPSSSSLIVSHYDHFYNCVPKYLMDHPVIRSQDWEEEGCQRLSWASQWGTHVTSCLMIRVYLTS